MYDDLTSRVRYIGRQISTLTHPRLYCRQARPRESYESSEHACSAYTSSDTLIIIIPLFKKLDRLERKSNATHNFTYSFCSRLSLYILFIFSLVGSPIRFSLQFTSLFFQLFTFFSSKSSDIIRNQH